MLLASVFAIVSILAAAPVQADTLGGEALASPHRTATLLEGAAPLPDVWASTWILADAATGEVLAQKGSHVQRAPASTLKMLTALTVLPQTTPEQTYVATPRAANIYGARVGLRPGRSYTLDELWYAVFLPSANDAAIAVAQANGGVGRTVDQMNAVARQLQANDTTAKSPNGLDKPGQYSSAYDLALIARAGLARPDFAHYAGTAKAQFPNAKGKGSHTIYTTNRLLLHGWKGAIGVKTGFTSQAGRTYVGAATRKGRTLIVALMGIHESSESAAKKLLKWGFANRDAVTPIGMLVDPLAPGTEPAASATPAVPDEGTASQSGTGTQAASPSDGGPTSPAPILLLVVALAAAGLTAFVVAARRRHGGRHAA